MSLNFSASTGVFAKPVFSRYQLAPPSTDVNTPRSVPTNTCNESVGCTTTDNAGICGSAVGPLPTLGVHVAPPSTDL